MQFIQWLLIAVVCAPLILVMINKLRMDLAAIIIAILLGGFQFFGLGMLGPAQSPKDAIQSISGFSQPVVITLIALFIITRGLDKSGVTRWLARQILHLSGKHEGRLIALFAATTALLSLFMNNLAAGALLLPSAMEASRRTRIRPSKLLIPVAYGSLLGGSATYFTTANIIMSDLLRIAHPPQAPLHILDFTPTGGLIAIAGILFLGVFGKYLLPDRESSAERTAARPTGSELEDIYQLGERLWEARVLEDSPLIGKTLATTEIGKQWGITIIGIRRGKEDLILTLPNQKIIPRDILFLVGRAEKISNLNATGLETSPVKQEEHLSSRGVTFFEIILAPHSNVEGRTLREIDFRQRFGLTIVALKRPLRSYRTDVGDIPLVLGDSLLGVGQVSQIQLLQKSPDFIVIEADPGDQPVEIRPAVLTGLITLGAIGASIAGVPVYLSMLTGAVLTILLNVVNMEEAYRAVEWQAVFLIAGMYTVSLAMVQTGLADLLGKNLLFLAQPMGPLGIALGAYLLTAFLTQFMGGQVSALVTGPITISAAISMGVNPQAIAVATAIGCSASFLTPMAHPVNILMIGPANYKFSDFFRVGWILTLISFVMLWIGLFIFWKL